MEPGDDKTPGSTPSVAMRGGLCGVFVDFDLLPRLLARAERGGGDRTETTADWSTFLDSVEFEQRHIDPDQLPSGLSVADRTAADAWRFAERMGFVDPSGMTADGREVAILAESGSQRRRDALAPMLAARVEARLRGQGGVPIVDLLRRAARDLAGTTNLWARECPGLVPSEVGAIVHWACVNARRANDLVDNVVTWRDAAMHRYGAPNPVAPRGVNAELHFDVVSEFYPEHAWLGQKVPWSFAEELAMSKLLAYCRLFRESASAPSIFWLEVPPSAEDNPRA